MIQSISFGYSNKLTQLYKGNKLPIIYDLHGDKLNSDVFIRNNTPLEDQGTFEHIKPKSKGGTETLGNSAIVRYDNNQKRGNMPFWDFYKPVDVVRYFAQFLDLKVKGFNGNHYINEAFYTIMKEGNQ